MIFNYDTGNSYHYDMECGNKNGLTNSFTTDTLTLDGGPGSGRYPKGSGKKNQVSQRESLPISPKERAKVGHDINNLYHARYKGKRSCMIVTRSNEPNSPMYTYRFKNHGFDNYEIYMKTEHKK